MKTFGKFVATAGALLLVGALTFGAVSYASAQDSDDNNNPTTAQQQWGNGAHFGDGTMGWFGERFHNWMSQRMGSGQMGGHRGMMGRMGEMGGMGGMMQGKGMGSGMGNGRFAQGGEMLTTVATALNMSEADLRTAMTDGKSIADLATEKGVDLQVVINAIMLERKAKLDEAVAAGTMTQERADQMLTMMAQMVPEHLNQPMGSGMGQHMMNNQQGANK